MNSFRTIVQPSPVDINFNLKSKVMLLGSCFSDNIGRKLRDTRVETSVNPHGIVFNPLSVVACLKDYLNKKTYEKSDLISRDTDFLSLQHHGAFSGSDPDVLLEMINTNVFEANSFLRETNVLILTLGTAWTYFYKKNNRPVANCHRLPSKDFEKKLLNFEEITLSLQSIFEQLKSFNPTLKIILTVSPVRHWKDGAVENSLSKSHLVVAVNLLANKNKNVHYFPAFEIMMDDLRDYRFYNQDMLHPSLLAVDYIWQKFLETYFDNKTVDKVKKIAKIAQIFNHRPTDTTKHQLAKDQALKSIEKIINS